MIDPLVALDKVLDIRWMNGLPAECWIDNRTKIEALCQSFLVRGSRRRTVLATAFSRARGFLCCGRT